MLTSGGSSSIRAHRRGALFCASSCPMLPMLVTQSGAVALQGFLREQSVCELQA